MWRILFCQGIVSFEGPTFVFFAVVCFSGQDMSNIGGVRRELTVSQKDLNPQLNFDHRKPTITGSLQLLILFMTSIKVPVMETYHSLYIVY